MINTNNDVTIGGRWKIWRADAKCRHDVSAFVRSEGRWGCRRKNLEPSSSGKKLFDATGVILRAGI